MTTPSISHYLIAEPDDEVEKGNSEIPLQNYLRERLLEVRRRNYSNTAIADAKAIEKISSEFEILVFGPSRVGKSTLIQQLSGDEQIRTSSGLNSCTQMTSAYTDEFGVRWWDTRGIEQWTENEARAFLQEKFVDRNILPRAAIFCRTAGSLANTPVLRFVFDQLKRHGITIFFVITRWPFLSRREQIEIVDEAIDLFGGQATGIYPTKQQVEIVAPPSGFNFCRSSRRLPPVVTAKPSLYRALECEVGISYIIPVNSCADESGDPSASSTKNFPVMNLNLLRQLIIVKTCRGADQEEKLIDLYKNQISLLLKLGYHTLEVFDDLGYGAASFSLTKKEEEVYRALKQGGNNRHMATATVKAVVDKITSSFSGPMLLAALVTPLSRPK